MQIILLEDIKGTGKKGDIVKVSDGFARNSLIPKGKAVEATDANKKQLEKKKALEEQRIKEEKALANELKEKLYNLTVEIKTKAGENGKVFGSITSQNIADECLKQTGIELDKKKIVLPQALKTVGLVNVQVKLYPEIQGELKVNIVAE